jgi:hypothetical protein
MMSISVSEGEWALASLGAMRLDILAGHHVYGEAERPTPGECEHDIGILARMIAARVTDGDVTFVRVLITYETEG